MFSRNFMPILVYPFSKYVPVLRVLNKVVSKMAHFLLLSAALCVAASPHLGHYQSFVPTGQKSAGSGRVPGSKRLPWFDGGLTGKKGSRVVERKGD
jgi:hypothetical protein